MMLPRITEARRLWDDNRGALERECGVLSRTFALPAQALEDTVRRRFVMDLAEGRTNATRGLGWKLAAFGWVVINGLWRTLTYHRPKVQHFDVLLDYWGADNFIFYKESLERLAGAKVGVLSREPVADGYPDSVETIYRPVNGWMPGKIAVKSMSYVWGLLWRSLATRGDGVSIFYVGIVLVRKIGNYFADLDGVRAKVFLSSGDNYFEGARYAVYRAAGVESVQVIQNGARGAWIADVHLYADVYYSMGTGILDAIPGHRFGRVQPVGSMRALGPVRRASPELSIRFDITFIEQLFSYDISGTGSVAAYDQVVAMIARFARENPQLRICLAVRPGRNNTEPDLVRRREAFDSVMRGTGVTTSEELGLTSYEAVAVSRLAITYSSTLGAEAFLFGRRFLYCMPDDLLFLSGDGVCFLRNPSYQDFVNRVWAILAMPPGQGDDEYERASNPFVIFHPDPGKVIAGTVKAVLEGQGC